MFQYIYSSIFNQSKEKQQETSSNDYIKIKQKVNLDNDRIGGAANATEDKQAEIECQKFMNSLQEESELIKDIQSIVTEDNCKKIKDQFLEKKRSIEVQLQHLAIPNQSQTPNQSQKPEEIFDILINRRDLISECLCIDNAIKLLDATCKSNLEQIKLFYAMRAETKSGTGHDTGPGTGSDTGTVTGTEPGTNDDDQTDDALMEELLSPDSPSQDALDAIKQEVEKQASILHLEQGEKKVKEEVKKNIDLLKERSDGEEDAATGKAEETGASEEDKQEKAKAARIVAEVEAEVEVEAAEAEAAVTKIINDLTTLLEGATVKKQVLLIEFIRSLNEIKDYKDKTFDLVLKGINLKDITEQINEFLITYSHEDFIKILINKLEELKISEELIGGSLKYQQHQKNLKNRLKYLEQTGGSIEEISAIKRVLRKNKRTLIIQELENIHNISNKTPEIIALREQLIHQLALLSKN